MMWSTGDGRPPSNMLTLWMGLTGDGPVIARTGARFPSSTLVVNTERDVLSGVRALLPGDTMSSTGAVPSILPTF